MNFASWVADGIARLTPEDLGTSDRNLPAKTKKEKEVGTVDGDLLKLWALVQKEQDRINAQVAEFYREHAADQAKCRSFDAEMVQDVERHELLARIFWHDAKQRCGVKKIDLRKGMVIVEEEDRPENVVETMILSTRRRSGSYF